jgi:hypothetical protein
VNSVAVKELAVVARKARLPASVLDVEEKAEEQAARRKTATSTEKRTLVCLSASIIILLKLLLVWWLWLAVAYCALLRGERSRQSKVALCVLFFHAARYFCTNSYQEIV